MLPDILITLSVFFEIYSFTPICLQVFAFGWVYCLTNPLPFLLHLFYFTCIICYLLFLYALLDLLVDVYCFLLQFSDAFGSFRSKN